MHRVQQQNTQTGPGHNGQGSTPGVEPQPVTVLPALSGTLPAHLPPHGPRAADAASPTKQPVPRGAAGPSSRSLPPTRTLCLSVTDAEGFITDEWMDL